jgi:hypothetical protein
MKSLRASPRRAKSFHAALSPNTATRCVFPVRANGGKWFKAEFRISNSAKREHSPGTSFAD